jgi:hypothetical protein
MWLRRAADQGEVQAQLKLAYLYAYGEGVAEDRAEAVVLYEKAAEQGSLEAMYYVGSAYSEGLGVEEDYFKAAQ